MRLRTITATAAGVCLLGIGAATAGSAAAVIPITPAPEHGVFGGLAFTPAEAGALANSPLTAVLGNNIVSSLVTVHPAPSSPLNSADHRVHATLQQVFQNAASRDTGHLAVALVYPPTSGGRPILIAGYDH
ncbi:hypothetical protein [Nocardia terpenica]|uniref:Uncharacterized protein n=1 Tax=Nocardia terpenica TaxID=455432 RepID=A0A6G9ZDU2_9NOCA|nr:hypothetical protein [Nocardia terpenica]QIS23614.1 hypothetical protein F6W96_40460 [Nocardia terpenica]